MKTLLVTLNIFHTFSSLSIVDFERVDAAGYIQMVYGDILTR